MAGEQPKLSSLDAVKKAVDALVTDTSLDDDTKGDMLEEAKEYIDEQQDLLGEDDDDEEDEDEEEDEEEDDEEA